MNVAEGIEGYLDTMASEGIYPNRSNLRFKVENLFHGLDFTGRRVLDIGGGDGVYSYYAACSGARDVVCLEPEVEGSSEGMNAKFARLDEKLQLDNVHLEAVTLQEYEPSVDRFDIVLLHNSINHLDEPACVRLLENERSQEIYTQLFRKISGLMNPGGQLIICDCSRHNFFGLCRIRNPFAPTIEWHKHQSPEMWAKLLVEAGFVNPRIKWSSFNRLGRWGQVLTGNRLMAYFLISHFCLTMEKR